MDDRIVYMDAAHLTSTQWLKDDRDWCLRDEDGIHLVRLPLQSLTDFAHGLSSIQSDLTLAESECQQPSRTATRSTALEGPSRIGPGTHYRLSLLCQTCLHILRETSSAL